MTFTSPDANLTSKFYSELCDTDHKTFEYELELRPYILCFYLYLDMIYKGEETSYIQKSRNCPRNISGNSQKYVCKCQFYFYKSQNVSKNHDFSK